jgi:hypothetical protein
MELFMNSEHGTLRQPPYASSNFCKSAFNSH